MSGNLCPGDMLAEPRLVGLAYCCSPPEAFFSKLSHVVNTCQTDSKALLMLRAWSKAGVCVRLPSPLSLCLLGAIVVSSFVVFERGQDGTWAL